MFGRKKQEPQERNEPVTTASRATTPAASALGSSGSLALRKPTPAKPIGVKPGEVPGVTAPRRNGVPGLIQDTKTLVIARDIAIEGKIGPCERLLIEGQLDAAVGDCRDIEIARNAIFKGSIRVEDADIAGVFEGEITVRRRLRIRSSGRVRGRVQYGHIEIEPGGQVDGEVTLLQPVVPQPSSETAANDHDVDSPVDA